MYKTELFCARILHWNVFKNPAVTVQEWYKSIMQETCKTCKKVAKFYVRLVAKKYQVLAVKNFASSYKSVA